LTCQVVSKGGINDAMRVAMGLIKNEHGVYCERRRVPAHLQAAVATVLGVSKARQSWLKKSLRTKDQKEAKVRAKPVMMEFDRIIAQAEALMTERPLRTFLASAEIKRIAEYHYAAELADDAHTRRRAPARMHLPPASSSSWTMPALNTGCRFR
jgi:hypothetical protein